MTKDGLYIPVMCDSQRKRKPASATCPFQIPTRVPNCLSGKKPRDDTTWRKQDLKFQHRKNSLLMLSWRHTVQLSNPTVNGTQTFFEWSRRKIQSRCPSCSSVGSSTLLWICLLPTSQGLHNKTGIFSKVCNEVDQWPAPVPGKTLSLPIMGIVIQVRIPSKSDKVGTSPLKQFNQKNLLPAPMVIPTVNELDFFRCFQQILIHIQMVWELMLLGEPIIVMASSPTISSDTVLALISCIAPLKYCCDYRPYFTIHDNEFKEYTTRTQAPPNAVLGVTNPFFIKTFQHWSHIIRLGEIKMSGDLPKQIKVKKLMKIRTLDTKPGIYTSYRTFLHKDKTLIKRLLKGIQRKRPSEVQSAIVRRHLLELTQSFIIPLERYVASLMPLQRTITAWKNPPQIRPFIQEEFMKTLEHAGPQLTSVLKGDWVGLYRRFIKSPNFDGWFRMRHQEMCKKLEILHLEVLCQADLLKWVREKSEVEIVDLVLKLREKLIKARVHQLPVREDLLEKLELYVQTVIGSLPDDLQVVLH
ncbi:protein DENND6B isoform X5 [Narcine bancroftii]|uniref:protein DENND6B isoform X5 n=1 Tax=Narcine bancroftii TaxID=1343680 RepID=UPI003831ADB1